VLDIGSHKESRVKYISVYGRDIIIIIFKSPNAIDVPKLILNDEGYTWKKETKYFFREPYAS